MNHDEWVATGRPHWQCITCLQMFVTIPPADSFECLSCQAKVFQHDWDEFWEDVGSGGSMSAEQDRND